jgi:hypothetical protein
MLRLLELDLETMQSKHEVCFCFRLIVTALCIQNLPLPRNPSVTAILERLSERETQPDFLMFLSELQINFNRCLCGFLLFEQEFQQAADVADELRCNILQQTTENPSDLATASCSSTDSDSGCAATSARRSMLPPELEEFSDVYGAEHLLRFLHKFPEFIVWGGTELPASAVDTLKGYIESVLGFDFSYSPTCHLLFSFLATNVTFFFPTR